MFYNEGKKEFEKFEEYIAEIIINGLKNTIYENDIQTIENIFNNVFCITEEMMFNDIQVTNKTYEDIIKQEFLKIGIA